MVEAFETNILLISILSFYRRCVSAVKPLRPGRTQLFLLVDTGAERFVLCNGRTFSELLSGATITLKLQPELESKIISLSCSGERLLEEVAGVDEVDVVLTTMNRRREDGSRK